jgi:hypothetical protein
LRKFFCVFNNKAFALSIRLSGEISPKDVNFMNILTQGVNFTNVLRAAFMLVDPESVQNKVNSSVSFYAFGIYAHQSFT